MIETRVSFTDGL